MTEYRTAKSSVPDTTLGDSPTSRGAVERPRAETDTRARQAVDDVRQQAGAVASEAKEQGKAALERRKDSAAGQLDAVAGALHETADELHRGDQPQAGRFIEYAADRLESFGRNVRDKNLDTLIDDATRMARRSPATFFAGSMAAGFLLARFLKSSADARLRDSPQERPRSDAQPITAPKAYPATNPLPSATTATASSGSALTSADFPTNPAGRT